jgi:hypothetical protein
MEPLYDEDGHYVLEGLDYWKRKGWDPAWPGQTPEPMLLAQMAPDLPEVPVAFTFYRDFRPQHIRMIREMLRRLPGRRLTKVVGHGMAIDSWMACNDGPDGHGSWCIPRDLSPLYRTGRIYYPVLRSVRRVQKLVGVRG